MVDISPTLQRLEKAEAEYKQAKKEHAAKLAELHILKFAELFEPYPQLESFGFEVYSEYNDEGGYYWAISASVQPSDELGSYEEEYTTIDRVSGENVTRSYTVYVAEQLEERLSDDIEPETVVALCNRINGTNYNDPGEVGEVDISMDDFRRVLAEIS